MIFDIIKQKLSFLNFEKEIEPPKNFIVTGIPRSGTSYLCNLLHRYNNTIIINEPHLSLIDPLLDNQLPGGLAEFYKTKRKKILKKIPIGNKLTNGKVTEDTSERNEIQNYIPAFRDNNFVLGSKNTLRYLTRLDRIRTSMPQAKIIVCVRNPYDTIASWKNSFAHLRKGSLSEKVLDESLFSPTLGVQLKAIREIENESEKRAVLWNFFAQVILEQIPKGVGVIRYSEMVTNPSKIIQENFHNWDLGDLMEPLHSSEVRSKIANLEEDDYKMIDLYCLENARKLGLL